MPYNLVLDHFYGEVARCLVSTVCSSYAMVKYRPSSFFYQIVNKLWRRSIIPASSTIEGARRGHVVEEERTILGRNTTWKNIPGRWSPIRNGGIVSVDQ